MVAHNPVVAGALIAERHATFRRQAAEERVSRMARCFARLAHHDAGLLADGSLVAEWAVRASIADLEVAA